VAKLASKEELYRAIKTNIYVMQKLLEGAGEATQRFVMAHKLNEQLIKIWERYEEREEPQPGEISLREVLDRIVALDDKKEVVSYEQESKTYIAS
jgi:hypothetical protein